MLRTVLRHRDPLIAGALAVTMTVETLAWGPPRPALTLALGLLATVPLAVRRNQPLASFVAVMLGINLITHVAPGFDNDSGTFVAAFLLSLFSLGRWAARTEAVWGVVAVLVVMVEFAISEGGDPGDYAFVLAFVGAPWAAGIAIRLRREREAVLLARNEQLRAEQEEATRRAVAAERSRIARELHDVVSHAISVTVLQSRGARRLLGQDDAAVRTALDAIEQTNTAALGDMRRLLAVLRDTEPDAAGWADHTPQPSLAHLDRLVDHVRGSGVQVDLEVDETVAPQGIPPGVDLSAYRIIQEALTNVLKHAGGARAIVRLDYGTDGLLVEIRDNGDPAASRGSSGGGHGLIGIRERVAVVGGRVEAGPLPEGGFAVTAHLPYALEPS